MQHPNPDRARDSWNWPVRAAVCDGRSKVSYYTLTRTPNDERHERMAANRQAHLYPLLAWVVGLTLAFLVGWRLVEVAVGL